MSQVLFDFNIYFHYREHTCKPHKTTPLAPEATEKLYSNSSLRPKQVQVQVIQDALCAFLSNTKKISDVQQLARGVANLQLITNEKKKVSLSVHSVLSAHIALGAHITLAPAAPTAPSVPISPLAPAAPAVPSALSAFSTRSACSACSTLSAQHH